MRPRLILFATLFLGWAIGAIYSVLARPLEFDESHYYLPAIQYIERSLPRVDFRNYPFPGPPLALTAQALILRLTGSQKGPLVVAMGGWLVIVATWAGLLSQGDECRVRSWAYVFVPLLPFVLWNSWTLKHHTIAIAGLMIVLASKRRRSAARRRIAIASGSIVAGLTSQLTWPWLAAFTAHEAVCGFRLRDQSRLADATAGMLWILPAASLFWLWGGASPPMYRAYESGLEPSALCCITPHTVLSVGVLGFWLGPTFVRSMRNAVAVGIGTVIGTPLIAWGRWLQTTTPFDARFSGPISSVARGLGAMGAGILSSGLFACVVALGLLAIVGMIRERSYLAVLGIALWIGMMWSVPYLFESYHVYLITAVAGIMVRENGPGQLSLSNIGWFYPLVGIVYALDKLLTL